MAEVVKTGFPHPSFSSNFSHPLVFRFAEADMGRNELFPIAINLLGIPLGITTGRKKKGLRFIVTP
jgi:hypothetical protein